MISNLFRRHRARYDENGDIVLEPDGMPVPEGNSVSDGGLAWHITEPPWPEEIMAAAPDLPWTLQEGTVQGSVAGNLKDVRRHITEDVLEEGLRQYLASMEDAKPLLRDLGRDASSLLGRTWGFLTQPVWIPTRRGGKELGRGGLFLLDTIRFGGTFAFIFVCLFAALNYQSFWQITAARLHPFLASASLDVPDAALATALQDKLKLVPGLTEAGSIEEGNILSVLPLVGPPDNRVIIPKLDLNVPLVDPPYEALLAGDWPQVEKDIQGALTDGVVHYPGTANPGQAGNFFVTGHSSYYPWAPGKFKTVFARLHQLEPGDEYWVYFGGDKHRYVVRSKKEVSPSDVTVLDQPTDKRLATLMTCTPVGTSLRRLIILSNEVDPETGLPLKVGDVATQPKPKISIEALPI